MCVCVFIYFICVGIFPVCMFWFPVTAAHFAWRPEQGFRSSVTGVTCGCDCPMDW